MKLGSLLQKVFVGVVFVVGVFGVGVEGGEAASDFYKSYDGYTKCLKSDGQDHCLIDAGKGIRGIDDFSSYQYTMHSNKEELSSLVFVGGGVNDGDTYYKSLLTFNFDGPRASVSGTVVQKVRSSNSSESYIFNIKDDKVLSVMHKSGSDKAKDVGVSGRLVGDISFTIYEKGGAALGYDADGSMSVSFSNGVFLSGYDAMKGYKPDNMYGFNFDLDLVKDSGDSFTFIDGDHYSSSTISYISPDFLSDVDIDSSYCSQSFCTKKVSGSEGVCTCSSVVGGKLKDDLYSNSKWFSEVEVVQDLKNESLKRLKISGGINKGGKGYRMSFDAEVTGKRFNLTGSVPCTGGTCKISGCDGSSVCGFMSGDMHIPFETGDLFGIGYERAYTVASNNQFFLNLASDGKKLTIRYDQPMKLMRDLKVVHSDLQVPMSVVNDVFGITAANALAGMVGHDFYIASTGKLTSSHFEPWPAEDAINIKKERDSRNLENKNNSDLAKANRDSIKNANEKKLNDSLEKCLGPDGDVEGAKAKGIRCYDIGYMDYTNIKMGDEMGIIVFLKRCIDILVRISGALAVGFMVLGGFFLVISGSNEERVSQAKNMIYGSIAALLIIYLSYIIVSVLMAILYGGANII